MGTSKWNLHSIKLPAGLSIDKLYKWKLFWNVFVCGAAVSPLPSWTVHSRSQSRFMYRLSSRYCLMNKNLSFKFNSSEGEINPIFDIIHCLFLNIFFSFSDALLISYRSQLFFRQQGGSSCSWKPVVSIRGCMGSNWLSTRIRPWSSDVRPLPCYVVLPRLFHSSGAV